MSETAPLSTRAPAVAETPPVRAPQSGTQGNQDQSANQQGAPADAQPKAKAPDFKDPAIALSPRVAGIKVGDILEGQVQRIDGQQRAVVQNAKETLLVDPAANLKTGAQATIRVTQTTQQFLGQLVSANPKDEPDIPVRLALVAVRGLEMKQPEGQLTPKAPPSIQAPSSPASNTVEDILRAVARPEPAPKGANTPGTTIQAAKNAATVTPAQATLIKADISRSGPPQNASAAFEARHPQLGNTPKPITMTILPASETQATYLRAPPATSPIGQLLASGRAILANVAPHDTAAPAANARVPLAAGALKISIPDLPDLPLRAGDKVVLLSANAAPLRAEPTPRPLGLSPADTAAITASPTRDAAPAYASSPTTAIWPALHTLLSLAQQASPQTNPVLLNTRSAQLLSAVLGLKAEAKSVDLLNTVIPLKEIAEASNPDKTVKRALAALSDSAPEAERLLRTQIDTSLQLFSTGGIARAEPMVMPLILPNTEATLIASLFLFPPEQDEAEFDDNTSSKKRNQGQDKDFEVALTFERFGKTRLKGRIETNQLQLSIQTEHVIPKALEHELIKAFQDRCDACGYSGSIGFQNAE